MFGDYLLQVRGLMNINRYQTHHKHKRRSVAEHSWFVSEIAYGLARWERDKFKKHIVDMERVLFLAINHDVVESYTGDIPSPVKSMSVNFRNALLEAEEAIITKDIPCTLPQSWGPTFTSIHKELAELETIESKIVKAADLIDRVFECMEEINLYNFKPYKSILKDDLKKLKRMDLMSVDYFLKYSIKDIGAYKYIEKNIRKELEDMDFSPYF